MNTATNKSAFLIFGALILLLLAFMRWDGETLKYLFYLRVPLVGGALLFALPAICLYAVPTVLGNLFVLGDRWRLALAIPGAVAVGLAIVLVGAAIGANADERFGVVACPWFESLAADRSPVAYLLAVVLAFPSACAAYLSSGPDSGEMSEADRRFGALAGAGLSLLFLGAVYWLRSYPVLDGASRALIGLVSVFLPEQARAGLLKGNELAPGHVVLASFLVVSTLLYLIGLFLYRPSASRRRRELPAISYVLGLLQIFTLLLGLLTFTLDLYRIPVLLSLLAFSALGYWLWKVDHYYDIRQTGQKPLAPGELLDALKNRLAGQEGDKTLVVVCASGGGIQAAGWTTMVLRGLQQRLGSEFTRAIGLISAVSGGSVGTMYLLDAIDKPVGSNLLDDPVFQAATKDSLGATGWGLVYPDLWRFVGLPFLKTHPRDRGAAINAAWKAELTDGNATLHGWADPIRKGDLPVPVFNATLVEDGRRYLLSPLTFDIEQQPGTQAVEFNGLYQNCDIDVSTAALLSATFPYVTPITRNSRTPKPQPIFHVADGGYFDNFGVVTAIDWLERMVLPNRQALELKKVFFVEIRAFPDAKVLKSAPEKPVGFLMTLLGPILTVFQARNSTQDQRNRDDVEELKKEWKNKDVDIADFRIAFPETKTKEFEFFAVPTQTGYAAIDRLTTRLESEELQAKRYKPPLSWTMTQKQREALLKAWQALAKDPRADVNKLARAWKERAKPRT